MLGKLFGGGGPSANDLLKSLGSALSQSGETGRSLLSPAGGKIDERKLKTLLDEQKKKEEDKKKTNVDAVAPVAKVQTGVDVGALTAANAARRGAMTGSYITEPREEPSDSFFGRLLGLSQQMPGGAEIATPIPEMYGVSQDHNDAIERQARNAGVLYAQERLSRMAANELPEGLSIAQVYQRLVDEGVQKYMQHLANPLPRGSTETEIANRDTLAARVQYPGMLQTDLGLLPGEYQQGRSQGAPIGLLAPY